tara:strand:- start:3029 stop:3406 length:378 start_codon:yes stop_codon:yes gene_type:complete
MSMLRYTTEHEWLRAEDDGGITVGISDYAQEQLGDIVFVELPEPGSRIEKGTNVVIIESVKTVGEVAMPFDGKVVAVNERLVDEPEIVNAEPFAGGWLVRLEADGDPGLDACMDEAAYAAFIADL